MTKRCVVRWLQAAVWMRARAKHMNNTNAHTTIHNPYWLRLYTYIFICNMCSFVFMCSWRWECYEKSRIWGEVLWLENSHTKLKKASAHLAFCGDSPRRMDNLKSRNLVATAPVFLCTWRIGIPRQWRRIPVFEINSAYRPIIPSHENNSLSEWCPSLRDFESLVFQAAQSHGKAWTVHMKK